MAYYNNETITFQSLVMKQVQKIQEITSKELRDGDKTVKNLIGEQTIESEDTRYSYLQAVEMLGSLLSPYFIKINGDKEDYAEIFKTFCTVNDIELSEAIEDPDFKKEVKDYFKFQNVTADEILGAGMSKEVNAYLLNYKIKEGRKMFRLLFKLIKHYDFFSSTSYSDSDLSGGQQETMDAIDDDEDDE